MTLFAEVRAVRAVEPAAPWDAYVISCLLASAAEAAEDEGLGGLAAELLRAMALVDVAVDRYGYRDRTHDGVIEAHVAAAERRVAERLAFFAGSFAGGDAR